MRPLTKLQFLALYRLSQSGTLTASRWNVGSSTIRRFRADGLITSESRKQPAGSTFATEIEHTITDKGRAILDAKGTP